MEMKADECKWRHLKANEGRWKRMKANDVDEAK